LAFEIIRVYDNSQFESRPNPALEAGRGSFIRIANAFPTWLQGALGWKNRELERHRKQLARPRDFETMSRIGGLRASSIPIHIWDLYFTRRRI